MQKSILFTFTDEAAQQQFLTSLNKVLKKAAASKSMELDVNIVSTALKDVVKDPELQQEGQRATAVFVGPLKVFEGIPKDCLKRFQFEIGSHKGSVELREKRDGAWVTLKSRKFQ